MANEVTSTTADKFINDVWADELNAAIEFELVLMNLFQDWSSKLKGGGDTVHLPARHNLTANTKSAGSDLTPEAITETEQTFQVSTHVATCQDIEDFAEVMSKYDIRAEYNKASGYSLGRKMDVDCAAVIDDNTTQTVGVLGSELSFDNLLTARTLLRNSSAPRPWIAAVSPATYSGFLKYPEFTRADYTGDGSGKAIKEAHLGNAVGMTFYESQLLTGTSPSSSGCVWSKSHYFKIVKRNSMPHALYDPKSLSWILSTDAIYGVFEREEADEGAALTTTGKLWSCRLQSKK